MIKTTTTTEARVNLASIVHASEEAARAAAAAQAKALEAAAKAAAARERAEAERDAAARRHLEHLQAAYLDARAAATTAVGDARRELEVAVRDGADLFAAYFAWTDASVRAWELESEVQQARDYLGVAARSTSAPQFNFATDVGALVDQHSMELQDQALERIRERRSAFLNGEPQ